MNNILFFTDQSVSANGMHHIKDNEFSLVRKSILDNQLTNDFNLIPAIGINKQTFFSTISKDQFKVIHFTVDCSCDQENLIGDMLPCEVKKCFESLSSESDTQCIIFNGNNTAHIAKSMAEFAEFTIGTNRNLPLSEVHSFSEAFFKSLAESRTIFNQTIVKAFSIGALHSELSIAGSHKEHGYVLFTTKLKEVSKISESPNTHEVKSKSDCDNLLEGLRQVSRDKARLNALNQNLSTAHIHQRMVLWIDHYLNSYLEETVKYIIEEVEIEDPEDFLFDLKQFVTIIKNSLKYNALTNLAHHGVEYDYTFSYYQLAFQKLNLLIPSEGDFDPESRMFLSEILTYFTSHISR